MSHINSCISLFVSPIELIRELSTEVQSKGNLECLYTSWGSTKSIVLVTLFVQVTLLVDPPYCAFNYCAYVNHLL